MAKGLLLGLAVLALALAGGCSGGAPSTSVTPLSKAEIGKRIDKALTEFESAPADQRASLQGSLAVDVQTNGTEEQKQRFEKLAGSSPAQFQGEVNK